jgi:hypothetical protein
VCSVHAFDVEGGVGFGVAQTLGFFQHHVKVQALVAHFGQDEVGGAVDDACQPLDAVGRQAFTQRLDDGNTAGHSRFKRHHHTFGAGSSKNFGAMHSQQRFVGGDHVLACGNGFHHQGLGDAVTTNQLDDDVDVRVGNDGAGVAHHSHALTHGGFGTGHVKVGHHGDLDTTACTTRDFFLVAFEHVERAAANGTDAQQADLDGFHDDFLSKFGLYRLF